MKSNSRVIIEYNFMIYILIFRYLLMSLRSNNDPSDAVDKARVIVDWMPEPWLKKAGLKDNLMAQKNFD